MEVLNEVKVVGRFGDETFDDTERDYEDLTKFIIVYERYKKSLLEQLTPEEVIESYNTLRYVMDNPKLDNSVIYTNIVQIWEENFLTLEQYDEGYALFDKLLKRLAKIDSDECLLAYKDRKMKYVALANCYYTRAMKLLVVTCGDVTPATPFSCNCCCDENLAYRDYFLKVVFPRDVP